MCVVIQSASWWQSEGFEKPFPARG